ncbi:MAG: TIGR02281 family clan AA aspartic protease [Gammaproteobacteria bacterium]|nr:TIGR02281 family clan AA aspartic protease [Gammaproteobacteria bacterium]
MLWLDSNLDKERLPAICLIVFLGWTGCGNAFEKIQLQALFGDKAIMIIDGERHLLKTGDITPGGIRLISTDTVEEIAVIESQGETETLKLGVVSSGSIETKKEDSLTLWADPNGHFFTAGYINGTEVRFLVDTGATSIALNSIQAKQIGLDYKLLGKRAYSSTASGIVEVFQISLNNVRVGDITLHNVDAVVIEGAYPTEALLGMSFLSKVDLRREGNQMHFLLKH